MKRKYISGVGQNLNTIIFKYICVFSTELIDSLILMYLNTFWCILIHRMVLSQYSYCVVKCLPDTRQLTFCTCIQLSIEHFPIFIIVNYITLLFNPLSTILNYYCKLLPLYIHIVLVYHCI